MNFRALIVDDDPRSRESLMIKVKKLGHEVETVGSQTEAFAILEKTKYHYALVDLHMIVSSGDSFPDKKVGLETIEYIRKHYPQMKIIAVTAYDEQHETTRDSLHYGADDFWSKNINKNMESIESKIARLISDPSARQPLEAANSMEDVEAAIKKLAGLDVTVLLTGETGTGKSYYAEQMHKLSNRKGKRFIPINSATLKGNFFVSEIFGHVQGAYTGADKKRKGAAKTAQGGTLFLDEIGDLDSECQAELLRFIETKEIKPQGSDDTEVVDVRLILATSKDLKTAVEEGKFRRELLARITAYTIELPPLRQRRPEEITKLAKAIYGRLLKEHKDKSSLKDVRIKTGVFEKLGNAKYSWPDNVRELARAIEKAMLLKGGRDIQVEDIMEYCDPGPEIVFTHKGSSLGDPKCEQSLSDKEKRIISIIKSKKNVTRADFQQELGIGSTAVWKLLKKMTEKGLIQKVGSGNYIRYALTE